MRDLDLGEWTVPSHLLRASTARSGGPGGQNVNKLETKVTVEVPLAALPLPEELRALVAERLRTRISRDGVLKVTAQAARTQLANRDRALARLEELLREALRPVKARRPTRVTRTEKEKRRLAKKRRSETKRLRSRLDD